MPDDQRSPRERSEATRDAGSVAGRTVLIAGATSDAGRAVAGTLIAAGARVIATGRDAARLEPLVELGAEPEVCDVTDEQQVTELAARLRERGIRLDGILPLVGGWRGGGGLAGQSDADYRVLEASLTALRHVSRAFDADLRDSDAGRLAIVSSVAVARPLAGSANYAAVKAGAEAWTRAVAQGYAKAARDAGHPLRSAAVIFRVKSLAGAEASLAAAFAALWQQDAAALNDTVIDLS
ncbi:MAG TPA: SDR family oxidoreductase [Microbacterium sp.]|uniref:SDR family NAD(P)-dependent oxidoreductase n=1 Tax=Microbacterium sp. TaxID=51671 RepID=UPI002B4661F7|nr:SDR family oxidoreductase [Microbacterium sp.]HKT55430.1 SDR family oxidoreductase [Microbacterium sp.]